MQQIKIGTIIDGRDACRSIRRLKDYGFESFSLHMGSSVLDLDLPKIAGEVRRELEGTGITVSSIGVYGNPLMDTPDGLDTRRSFRALVDAASLFGTDLVTGFSGALEGKSVEESLSKYCEVFGEIGAAAQERGVRIAFENCTGDGVWQRLGCNMAFHPRAWELMFQALPLENIGLEWEPCHQLVQLIDPIPQLRKWARRIFHVHGKDATVARDILAETGLYGSEPWCWHRTPGFGDSNWTDIISILMMNGYQGCIDIEGWHDPVYCGELEYTGQIHALQYLKSCRGGEYHDLG